MQILFLIPLVFLLYAAYREYYKKYWKQGLAAVLTFGNDVTEGESTTLSEEIYNRKRLNIPFLQVYFQVGKGLSIENGQNVTVSDRTNVMDIFSLGKYEKITRTLPVKCDRRGYYEILRTSIVTNDLIGARKHYAECEQRTSLYVYPGALPADRFDVTFAKMLGDVVTKRFLYEDVFTFRGIRDYTSADTMHSINWKASARSSELKVNLHDPTSSQEIILLLNVEAPSVMYDIDLLEDGIRLAMSLAGYFIRQQIPVSLRSNGKDIISSKDLFISAGSSADHLHQMAQGLARIDLMKKTGAMDELICKEILPQIDREGDRKDTTCILISSCQREALIAAAGRLAEKKGDLIWIAPLSNSMEQMVPEGKIHFYRVRHE